MKPTNKEYKELTEKLSPPSSKLKDCFCAFLVGGFICTVGQLLMKFYESFDLSEKTVKMAVPTTLVIIAAILTGLKLFNRIAKFAGAGTLVPITGFANAVVSPAIEFKNEGWVLGVGANIFKIAGPVITYGILAGTVYGIIYFITRLF